jgi:hypothetical protein
VTDWRRGELKQTLGFLRVCRRALCERDLARAFRWWGLASRSLCLARAFGGASNVTCTARLSRAVADVGDRIEEALRPGEAVDVEELVAEIAAGVDILRSRDGVVMTEEQARERGANIAARILGNYRIEPLANGDLCQKRNPSTGERTGVARVGFETGQKN